MHAESAALGRPMNGKRPVVFIAGQARNTVDHLLRQVAQHFYAVVPQEFRTYCVLTSEIARQTLRHFGVEAALAPCQLWGATPDKNFVLGFLGKDRGARKWDGHVVCRAGSWLLDTAAAHFEKDFGHTAPDVALVRQFEVPTQILARTTLSPDNQLWWLRPPEGAELRLPTEPAELIEQHARRLIARLEAARQSPAQLLS